MTTNNAFLVTENYPLGTELDDGLRVGPVNTLPLVINAVTNTPVAGPNGGQNTGNPYDQWGRGMLLASTSCYNIIPRGPSAVGNVVGFNATPTIPGAGNLVLSADGYVTTANTNGDGTFYLQLDWPRALSIIIGNSGSATLVTAATITVFGQDFYGAFMQEALTIPAGSAVGTYLMKKAFYVINRIYLNTTLQAGSTMNIQTTDTFGLPYRITSPGNIAAISWASGNDMGIVGTALAQAGAATGTGTLAAGTLAVATGAVAARSQVQYTENTNAGAVGKYAISAFTANTSFTILSSNNAETSTFNWALVPTNWASGTATLVGGTVFVVAPSVKANSNIMLSRNVLGGTAGFLAAPVAGIVPGVGFTINSYSAIATLVNDTSTVNWAIVGQGSPLSGSGKATLVAGAVTIPFSIAAGSTVLVTYDTPATAIGTYLQAPSAGITVGTSFTIVSQANTETSIVNWQVFAPNATLTTQLAPLGTFTPADQSTPSNTTGDVRGTYKPSSAANGTSILDFLYYVYGFDNFINQQANAQLSAGGTKAVPAVRDYVTFTSQFGQVQYYTGTNA